MARSARGDGTEGGLHKKILGFKLVRNHRGPLADVLRGLITGCDIYGLTWRVITGSEPLGKLSTANSRGGDHPFFKRGDGKGKAAMADFEMG